MAQQTTPLPYNIQRLYSLPFDSTDVVETLSGLTTYLSNESRYGGQIITCNEKEGSIFILNKTRDGYFEISSTGGTTNLSFDVSGDTLTIYSSSGNDITLSGATNTTAGLLTAIDKIILDSNNNWIVNSGSTLINKINENEILSIAYAIALG